MTKNECKNQIISFRSAVGNYEKIILNSDYKLSNDTQAQLITIQQSQLNQTYGKLEKYIIKFTKSENAYVVAFMDYNRQEIFKAIALAIRDLDYISGKLDSITEDEFSDLLITNNKNTTITDKDQYSRNFETRLNILEFLSALFFSVSFTLIFAIITIQGIWFNWPALVRLFVIFFGLTLFIIYFILPVFEITKKAGNNVKDVWDEFVSEFKNKTKLKKLKTIIVILSGIAGVITFVYQFCGK
ncbi:MAG: hypothetical protein AAB516_00030 [Patescibacteria group bacterium]